MSLALVSAVPSALRDDRFDWTRLRISQATSNGDPNAIEDPANRFADQSNGSIAGGLLGGVATTDPGSARWWTWRASDIFGQLITGAAVYSFFTAIREVTAPALATDTFVACGICNEADLNSATVDGWGGSFRYTGAARTVGVIRLLNGAAALTSDAAGVDTTRRLFFSVNRGESAGGVAQMNSKGLTDAGAFIAGADSAANAYTDASGDMYWWLAFGRLAATAGTIAVASSAFIIGYPAPRGGYVPT